VSDIKAIDKNNHSRLKIKPNPSLLQSEGKHFAPLVVQEFIAASQEFPILFIKDSETGQFKAIALLGLKPGENLFFDPANWQADYKPENLTLYPFLVSQAAGDENAIVCFDQASPLVNENEGEALFVKDSDNHFVATDWLKSQGERVVQYLEKTQITEHFIKTLLDIEIISPQTLNLKLDDQAEYSLSGLYAIDEKKLNALSDDKFTALRKTGALPAIYASLFSLRRIENLIRLTLAK